MTLYKLVVIQFNMLKLLSMFVISMFVVYISNPWPAELFVSIFSSNEAGITNAIII